MAQTHIAVRQNRVLAVRRCPIRRNTRGRRPKDMRDKPRNSNRRRLQKRGNLECPRRQDVWGLSKRRFSERH